MTEQPVDTDAVVQIARRALTEVADLAPAHIAVLGDGSLALRLRRDLGATGSLEDDPAPTAVIETTGTARSIALAIQRVASVGRVVLAAEPEVPQVDVRTYADIHVRGITVIAIPPTGPSTETSST
jgi:hypothetical protein